MQRDASACCTTPSGVMRIAITGHTWAHGATGSSQCMHTVGCVATLNDLSRKSTITMLSPLCESHSRQAASQARQPMQRDGSTNSVLTGIAIAFRQEGLLPGSSGGFPSPVRYGNISGVEPASKFSRGPSTAPAGAGASARSTAAAHTLNSGILTVGSEAELVTWLTACRSP